MNITSKVAVVTGAASGLGRAVAEALLHAGARVVLFDRDAERGAEVAAAAGAAALFVPVDVTSESQVQAGYVMEGGRIVLEGDAGELRSNEDVREFYLGLDREGVRRSFREVKHYRRRKRWLG